jgi:hypothetical protein
MSDSDKPNPIDDLRKGLGLLFRAAKTTIDKLPTGQIEEAVITGAREVGRALENVTHSVEEQFLRKPSARPADEAPSADKTAAGADAPKPEAPPEAQKDAAPTEPGDGKKRVG